MFGVMMLLAVSGFTLQAHTSRADYYVPAHTKLQADSATCEAFLTHTEQMLGVRVPRFTYYRVATPDDVFRLSGYRARGVSDPTTHEVWSMYSCHRHEIAHLAAYQLGSPGHFWHEGFAMVLAGESFDADAGKEYARLVGTGFAAATGTRDIFLDSDTENGDYRRFTMAAAFVQYLVQRYGVNRVIEFFRSCRTSVDAATAFQRIFGRPIQGAAQEWVTAQPGHP